MKAHSREKPGQKELYRMKYAVYSVSTPEYTIEETAALAKQMGYDGIEWRIDTLERAAWLPAEGEVPFALRYWGENKSTLDINNILEDAKRAKKVCDEYGLAIVNLATGIPHTQPERLIPVLEAAQAIGCGTVRAYSVGYNADSGRSFDDLSAELRKALLDIEPMLVKYGVRLLLETHHGTLIATASAARRVMEGLDPAHFGIIFDPGNMVYEGYEDYYKGFDLLGPYLAHVHVKNARIDHTGTDEFGGAVWKVDWAGLRTGVVSMKKLAEALVKIGYDGTLSMEDFSNETDTVSKLTDNIRYLRPIVEAAQAAAK